MSLEQLRLVRQQRDFVSAVSHELKTPLTSIRMYGEMLKSGWASEEKRKTYYEFIYAESERLSRLIENVLRLARLNHSERDVVLEEAKVGEIVDIVRSKVATQAEHAGFELRVEVDDAAAAAVVAVDADALSQVFINLVDNAIKFAARAERREIVVAARLTDREVALCVRDFGPGVPREALKRLFELFYRPADELTRSTPGTGIGLALVHELVTAMNGSVDVRNCEPGAEFRVSFAAVPPARAPQ
jgi:signal transduction histidine kinase